MTRAGASNVMLVTLLIPVTAKLLGTMFLTEAILVYELAGAAPIGLGLLFIDGRLPRRAMRVISRATGYPWQALMPCTSRLDGSCTENVSIRGDCPQSEVLTPDALEL